MSLSDFFSGALSMLKSASGVAVTYRRGTDSVSVTAIPGRSEVAVSDTDGVSINSAVTDFTITVDDLVLDGVATYPQRGDEIELTNGTVKTYEVLPIAGELYRFTDPYQTAFRIHTKLRSNE